MRPPVLSAFLGYFLAAICVAFLAASPAPAARVAGISGTKHNLSSSGTGSVTAKAAASQPAGTDPTQICVFCHTPHGGKEEGSPATAVTPLWNRTLPDNTTYTKYTSSSLDAEAIRNGVLADPAGSSKLCLSCHDGSVAIGNVGVLNGASRSISMNNVDATTGQMQAGTSGYTRNLGRDLSNDHPISVDYTAALAARDGELRSPPFSSGGVDIVGDRSGTSKPKLPLETSQVQCATCHDPHVKESDAAALDYGREKFLRMSRFQGTASVSASNSYDKDKDIMCLSCHDKENTVWYASAHANSTVANEEYTDAAANQREFKLGIKVWQAACLNCHDPHTIDGARRLTREGVSSGKPAIEQVCYQCHQLKGAVTSVLKNATTSGEAYGVPNIKDLFTTKTYHMPISSTDQGLSTDASPERHNIGHINTYNIAGTPADGWPDTHPVPRPSSTQAGANFMEGPVLLGWDPLASTSYSTGNLKNRHAECTDCHNPHRVLRNSLYDGTGVDSKATHTAPTNVAPGALKGSFGVEITGWSSASFGSLPSSFELRCGVGNGTGCNDKQVDREYQVCFKCHSNFAYKDDGKPESATRPKVGQMGGTSTSGTNGLSYYTNQAMEFQAPRGAGNVGDLTGGHKGETSTTDSGAFSGDPPGPATAVNFQTRNHRAWHPVLDVTGRTKPVRGGVDENNWLSPWNATAGAQYLGKQFMTCSDCHGSDTSTDPSGPHGSNRPFILKGIWGTTAGSDATNDLCFRCHRATTYRGTSGTRTGFWISSHSSRGSGNDGHATHQSKIGSMRCTWCHVAVPHGWKNKAFLVNLNDVGPEVLCRQADVDNKFCTVADLNKPMPAGTEVRRNAGGVTTNWQNKGYSNPPYYLNSYNKINNFRTSGDWGDQDCGSTASGGNGRDGWMNGGNEICKSPT